MDLKERQPIQLTDNGAANFGPYWHPDGRHIIFSSNLHDPGGRNFDLYLINIDTRALERITHFEDFDGFPMFSHDGRQLVFASNRFGKVKGETNIFIANFSINGFSRD
jgi:Tol biopolymer transport system component